MKSFLYTTTMIASISVVFGIAPPQNLVVTHDYWEFTLTWEHPG